MKIGVITPANNAEKHIGDCIDSVAASKVWPYEIIHVVVDDGSNDATWEEISQRSRSDLIACKLEKRMGAAYARNYGVNKTDADVLFCLDGDDVIFQNTLRYMANYMQEHEYDWVYVDFLRTDENLRYMTGQDYYGYEFSDRAEVLTSMFCGEHFFQQNCMYKRRVFDEVGGFDESRANFQDFEMFSRFLLAGYMPHHIQGAGYIHRMHDQNMSLVNGRQTNPDLHKHDVRNLYLKMEKQVRDTISEEQMKKVNKWLETD